MAADIRFDRVSKKFTLHPDRPRSFQEVFLNLLHLRGNGAGEPYWALRDVSFDIRRGEMVGIIGPNGAGKSTVLKLVSGIIEPTDGKIEVNGRLSALLELGAGFHPDLSGRENVYLNGSILGIGRAEMNRIFSDILEFSEMGRFIDVPVKHYSSGMYMRLAFSIAIHVRPEILLVDEVLAVGDQAFQLRCLDKIEQLKRRKVTIVLVTHDLAVVKELCHRAIWLDDGRVRLDGVPEEVIEQYLADVRGTDEQALIQASGQQQLQEAGGDEAGTPEPGATEPARRWGSREGEIVRVQLLDAQGQERRAFETGETLVVRIHYVAHRRIARPQFGLALYHNSGFHISGPNTVFSGLDIEAIEGQGAIDYIIDCLPLLEGTYLLSVSLYDYAGNHAYDYHHQAYTFRVYPNPAVREKYGAIVIPASWRLAPGAFSSSAPAGGETR